MMRINKYLVLIILALITSTIPAIAQFSNYENIEQHSSLRDNYKSAKEALSNIKEAYFYRKLDKNWFYKTYPTNAPKELSYLTASFNGEGFSSFNLPHINKSSSKASETVYFTTFNIPQRWDFREFFLKFSATTSAYKIYINGQLSGSNRDNNTSAIFNITKFAQEGENKLIIVCFKDENAFKIENQSESGYLNGDVFLYSTPKIRLSDYHIKTSFQSVSKNAELTLDLIFKTHLLNPKDITVKVGLYDKSLVLVSSVERDASIDMLQKKSVPIFITIADAKRYSSHSPYLYQAIVTVMQENRVIECVKIPIGLKELEINKNSIKLNQSELKIYGINYYGVSSIESDDQYKKRVKEELTTLKSAGFNAIKVKVAPQRELFYHICDSIGLYIFDQANINLTKTGIDKSTGGTIAADPTWYNTISERAIRALSLTKSYSAMISLNLMEEGSNGYNIYETFLKIKENYPNSILSATYQDNDWNNDIVIFKNLKDATLHKERPLFIETNLNGYKTAISLTNSEKISGFFIDASYTEIKANISNINTALNSFTIEKQDANNGKFSIAVKNNKTPLSDLQIKIQLFKKEAIIGTKTVPFQKHIDIDYTSFDGIKPGQNLSKSKDYSLKISITSETATLEESIFKLF